MLTNTFHHIPGIGAKSEQNLWQAGLTDWSCIHDIQGFKLSPKKKDMLRRHLEASIQRYEDCDPSYFEQGLPSNLHWRFFPEFREHAAYLDIETDGCDVYNGQITTIALYDGTSIKWYVNGVNLESFRKDIGNYKVLITYNGKCFDIPFIERFFGMNLPQAQIDLRYVLAALGFKGGLKRCETALDIDRGKLKGIDGALAPILWEDYCRRHDEKILETLLAYNIEDVLNLEILMVRAYNMNIRSTPFAVSRHIDEPDVPPIPFDADDTAIENAKRRLNEFMSYW